MWRPPTSAQTTIPCKTCGTPLKAERSCRKVTLACSQCRTSVDVKHYIASMDEALETFMDILPCDRI